ncbi:MAG: carbonic anhydrase, partial [Cyanobacteria bacterium K_DeepCast_35m_m2_023]|nr:carbonic anhydrase [Cyanobacteria bacterium K_DeepCast_35m_m2_023]
RGLASAASLLAVATAAARPAAAASTRADPALSACAPSGDPLQALLAGNQRFAAAWQLSSGPALTSADRTARMAALWSETCQLDPAALARGQRPWAAVLACADARVSPEWIFDVGPGELFDVRSAGNTAFAEGIASLEYAVAQLQVPLIVVLGHQSCGAVTAALTGQPLTPLLEQLVTPIRASLQPGDDLSLAVRHNTTAAARQLSERSAVLRDAVSARKLTIQPLDFNLETGLVSVI